MPSTLDQVRAEITAHQSNAWARELGYEPLYTAAAGVRIAVVGQAPGRKAQESGVPWDDASRVRLRSWLGVDDEQFYEPEPDRARPDGLSEGTYWNPRAWRGGQ